MATKKSSTLKAKTTRRPRLTDKQAAENLAAVMKAAGDIMDRKANEAFAAVGRRLTPDQRVYLLREAGSCRDTIKLCQKKLGDTARFYDRLANASTLTAADRRLLRVQLGSIAAEQFSKLGGAA
jgi:hypothetical protein